MIPNNAYLALEGVWRDTKKRERGGVVDENDARQPMSIPSPRSMSPSMINDNDAAAAAHKLNLSAICISNILMLEDRHIPSIFVRMYEHCLQRNDESPEDDENNARLRLLNYLFQRWHETRNKLTFYRDVFKVISVIAKPVIGEHMSIAVEMSPINQQHVMRELLRNLRRESRGQTLGEFLERYGTKPCNYTFHDMGLELFTRDDVREYDAMDNSNANVVHSFIGDILRHPVATYFNRLLLSITRSLCHLRLNMSASVSNKLFSTSVPSWAEEDTETGMINMDNETRERLRETRENITRLLTKRKIKMIEQRRKVETTGKNDEIVNESDGTTTTTTIATLTIPKRKDESSAPRKLHSSSKFEERNKTNDDDYRTIDTESFLGDNATLYSESIQPSSTATVEETLDDYNNNKNNNMINNMINNNGSSSKNDIRVTRDVENEEMGNTIRRDMKNDTSHENGNGETRNEETRGTKICETENEIRATERNLKLLLSKKLHSKRSREFRNERNVVTFDDVVVPFKREKLIGYESFSGNNNDVINGKNDRKNNNDTDNDIDNNDNANDYDDDDDDNDSILNPPTNVVIDNTLTTLRNVDNDIMRLSQKDPVPDVPIDNTKDITNDSDAKVDTKGDEVELSFDDLL